MSNDGADDDAAVDGDADRQRRPRRGELLEHERERHARRAEPTVGLRNCHSEDAETPEFDDDVARQRAFLLRRGYAPGQTLRPIRHRAGELALGRPDERVHDARARFTASVNAGTNSKTSATTP